MYLYIIEGPGKIQKTSKILGKDYIVVATGGHLVDLHKKLLSVEMENNYKPIYYPSESSSRYIPAITQALKKNITKVFIATDPDREGEAIGLNAVNYYGLKNYERLSYTAIDKPTIMKALKEGGQFDMDLVHAQTARRVLDRIVGWLVSPVISKILGKSVSAGRVQSPTLRLLVDKEIEIEKFINSNGDVTYYRVIGMFDELRSVLYKVTKENDKGPFIGEKKNIKLDEKPDDPDKHQNISFQDEHASILKFMKNCKESDFTIYDISDKISIRKPSAPFMTLSLQQEAGRRLGMSLDRIQKTSQKLYEQGYVTYIRTDSVEISTEGMKAIKKTIVEKYGKDKYQETKYKTKVKNAQEAHECIRPTDPDLEDLSKEITDTDQIRLYELIWKRTIASQMISAKVKVFTIQIDISKIKKYYFQSLMEKVVELGFMEVYQESSESSEDINKFKKLPDVGKKIKMDWIEAKQEFARHPARYSEPSLNAKMGDIGIGRPGTIPNIVAGLYKKGYITKGDIKGTEKNVCNFKISDKTEKITSTKTKLMYGQDKNKLLPTNLGKMVVNVLMEHFPLIMDYDFTKKMEDELDIVSNGKLHWHKVVDTFYKKLKILIDKGKNTKSVSNESAKVLGEDEDGHQIIALTTSFGDRIKVIVDNVKDKDIAVYVNLPEGETAKTITLKQAKKLLLNVKYLGMYEKKPMLLRKGDNGWYVSNGQKSANVTNGDVSLDDAVKALEQNNLAEYTIKSGEKKIKARALNGPYGSYLQTVINGKKKNYSIPKEFDATKLTDEQIQKVMEFKKKYDEAKKEGGFSRGKGGFKKNVGKGKKR